MTRTEILMLFEELSYSTGLYGRLLRDIYEDRVWGNEFLNELEAQNFGSELDLILYLES